jgi:hypothetical protein
MSIPRSRGAAPALVALGLAVVLTAILANRGSGAPAGPDAGADRKPLDACWSDLEKDEVAASRALLELVDRAKEAVPFLKDNVKPLRITSGQAKALLLKLNSADEHLWKTAFEELDYFDPRLAIDLTEMMERVTQSPARQRLVEVLSRREAGSLQGKEIELNPVGDGFNFVSRDVGSWWAEPKVARINSTRWGTSKPKWTRAERAIVVLGHIGTPEAISILKEMATGHPDAQPTLVAKEALQRLAADRKPMDACWAELEKGEVDASRALLELYDHAKEATPVLKEKMKPLTISVDQVKALLGKLGSPDERVWKPAFEELEYFDPRLAIGLEDLMEQVTDSPARQRMVEVLSERNAGSLVGQEIKLWRGNGFFNFNGARGAWWAENQVAKINSLWWGMIKRKWTRAERAIVLLEHVRTPEAITILRDMATGHPEARPTKVAREALSRIDGISIRSDP